MQKLWLKDFEHNISAATWNTADQLMQAGAVKALREVEKHFWVASVDDTEGSYEIEVMITPHKIKAFTCECWTEGRRLMCVHIAAALLKLRQFLEQKIEENKVKAEKRASNELNRITVGNVLDSATPEAIAEFVQEYARRDRDFALALKTWFAGEVSGAENPFALVLDSVIPKNLNDKKLREPDLRRLRQTLDDLNRQLTVAAEEHNYPKAFQIAVTILQRICPLIGKLEEQKRPAFLVQCRQAFVQLAKFQEQPLSPELKEASWSAVFDLAATEQFPEEMTVPVILFLNREAANEIFFRKISNHFDHVPLPAPPFVLHLFIGALAKRGAPESVIRVLEEYVENPALLREAIDVLARTHQTEAAYRAGEFFLDKLIFSSGQRREIERILADIARESGDPERQIKLLWRRFLQSNNFDYFNEMKSIAGADWPAEIKQRLSELRKQGNDNITAVVLAAEGEKEELAQLLEKQDDIRQFQLYENLFLPEDREFVRNRYSALMTTYLREHFGRQSSAYVREHLSGLMQKGEPEMVAQIIRTLVSQFSDRPSLPEELAELFPKSKRKAILQPEKL